MEVWLYKFMFLKAGQQSFKQVNNNKKTAGKEIWKINQNPNMQDLWILKGPTTSFEVTIEPYSWTLLLHKSPRAKCFVRISLVWAELLRETSTFVSLLGAMSAPEASNGRMARGQCAVQKLCPRTSMPWAFCLLFLHVHHYFWFRRVQHRHLAAPREQQQYLHNAARGLRNQPLAHPLAQHD